LQHQNDIMNKILFSEQQKMRPIAWIWFLFTVMVVPLMIFAADREDLVAILFMQAIFVALAALFWAARLDMEITKEYLSIKFFPFHRSFRTYRWDDVSKALIVRRPTGFSMRRKRGWGMGRGFRSRHHLKIYNGFGNKSLQLKMTDGRMVIIGTRKGEELEAILYKIGRLNKQ